MHPEVGRRAEGAPAAAGPLLVIAGPTATGKTEAALRIAERHGGEIVSADSMQIYKGMDIGTGKPGGAERARVRFHLIDCVDPREPYTVADFQREARAAIADIQRRGKLPVLCGGTGLYVRAVLGGLQFPPGAVPEAQAIRWRLEEEAREQGPAALHRRLAEVDPPTAARLPEGDVKRVIRALEVWELTGEAFSRLARVDGTAGPHYNARTFLLTCSRAVLYRRIEERVDRMMGEGWLAEVRRLAARGLSASHQAMQAIGYRHLLEYLAQGGDLAETVSLIKRDTRRFAKRQMTWFRREEGRWLEWDDSPGFEGALETIAQAADELQSR